MQYDQIRRPILERIRLMEQTLMTFHAYRHLWAELVANRVECGVTREKLEKQQVAQLSMALSEAYGLAQELGMEWEKCQITREESLRRISQWSGSSAPMDSNVKDEEQPEARHAT